MLFNRAQESKEHSAVTSDNFEGGKTVSKFLLAAGHKKLLILVVGKVHQHIEIVRRVFVRD